MDFSGDTLHISSYEIGKKSRKRFMNIRNTDSGNKWLMASGNGLNRVTSPIDTLYMPHVKDFSQIICIYEAYP